MGARERVDEIEARVDTTVRRRRDLDSNYINLFDIPTELFDALPGEESVLPDGVTRVRHIELDRRTDLTFFCEVDDDDPNEGLEEDFNQGAFYGGPCGEQPR